MGKATQDLREEHQTIIFVLKILNQMMLSKGNEEETLLRYYDEVVYFLKIFADKCHHGKEENYLFKELAQKDTYDEDGPVTEMIQQHVQARGYIAQMSQSIKEKDVKGFNASATQYIDLLHRHIDKETKVVFLMADNLIDEQAQDLMFEKFELHEENVIGHGVHEKLHAMIDTWAEAFNVE